MVVDMGHIAILDKNNVVESVVKTSDILDMEAHYSALFGKKCIQTSYNTVAGIHLSGGTPINKNYAGNGYHYVDGVGFHPPRPYPSWLLDDSSYLWHAPVPAPNNGNRHYWDENLFNETNYGWMENTHDSV
ncbi:hypothetical protein [Candidatus Magnetaquicoccus inordinatus]|uniref:hypothetical protein n=1 Tax=Candidatus Magnetaquicoccus inordinatus TaxID=2496818 RepID=UPI00102ACE05|nr:hypothetical protein [Candidatus Magnetaquicoccus inordinatus]